MVGYDPVLFNRVFHYKCHPRFPVSFHETDAGNIHIICFSDCILMACTATHTIIPICWGTNHRGSVVSCPCIPRVAAFQGDLSFDMNRSDLSSGIYFRLFLNNATSKHIATVKCCPNHSRVPWLVYGCGHDAPVNHFYHWWPLTVHSKEAWIGKSLWCIVDLPWCTICVLTTLGLKIVALWIKINCLYKIFSWNSVQTLFNSRGLTRGHWWSNNGTIPWEINPDP